MTREEIQKAFEGRWRVKAQNITTDLEMMLVQHRVERVKEMCLDFFEAGIAIGRLSEEQVKKENTCVASYEDACNMSIPFDMFWDAYDKKVGKPKAEKLWSKLSAKERAACLAYIPEYKQAQPDKQYRKNPETFLRNKCWNDELIYRSNGTNKPTIEQQRIDKLADVLAG